MSPAAGRHALAILVLALPMGAAARRPEAARVPMPAAKATCVERACRRVYGDAPQTVDFCTRTYLPQLPVTAAPTPFCRPQSALVSRMPACVEVLAAKMFAEVMPYALPYSGAGYTLDACSEAQLCGAPFL